MILKVFHNLNDSILQQKAKTGQTKLLASKQALTGIMITTTTRISKIIVLPSLQQPDLELIEQVFVEATLQKNPKGLKKQHTSLALTVP